LTEWGFVSNLAAFSAKANPVDIEMNYPDL